MSWTAYKTDDLNWNTCLYTPQLSVNNDCKSTTITSSQHIPFAQQHSDSANCWHSSKRAPVHQIFQKVLLYGVCKERPLFLNLNNIHLNASNIEKVLWRKWKHHSPCLRQRKHLWLIWMVYTRDPEQLKEAQSQDSSRRVFILWGLLIWRFQENHMPLFLCCAVPYRTMPWIHDHRSWICFHCRRSAPGIVLRIEFFYSSREATKNGTRNGLFLGGDSSPLLGNANFLWIQSNQTRFLYPAARCTM